MTTPHFTNIGSEIIQKLESAQKEIIAVVAWFTNPTLFEVIKNKRIENKIKIEIMISNDLHNYGKLSFDKLLGLGINIWVKETMSNKFMHNKYCIIDQKLVITGSYNWSVKAESNFENIIITDDKEVVERYYKHFNNILKHSNYTEFNQIKSISASEENIKENIEDTQLYNLEKNFNDEFEINTRIAQQAGIKIDFEALSHMINRYSAVGAAKRLTLADDGNTIQSGLRQLWEKNMLHLSFENMILEEKYTSLFNENVKAIARKKLLKLGYTPKT